MLEHLLSDNQLLAERRGNVLIGKFDPALPVCVEADEARLLQVVRNLLDNALKYTRDGRVELSVQRLHGGDHGSEGTPSEQIVALMFMASDTGPGIAEEQQALVFEPFGRSPESRHQPGIGLGLAIARQWVEAMGGRLSLDSRMGEGSRFSFELRLRVLDERLLKSRETLSEVTGYRGDRRRLLLIDDSPDALHYLADLCSGWGFEVVAAESAMEGIAQLQSAVRPFDAVLVDQFMPGMDGWACLRTVRALPACASLPVLLLSAAQAQRPADLAQELDFDATLLKPFQPAELAQALESALQLQWLHDGDGPGPSDEPAAVERPPVQLLEPLLPMWQLGQIVAIAHWCAQASSAHPQWARWFDFLRGRCAAVDLLGLAKALTAAGLVLPRRQ